ncbi:16S rRNA (guanine(527)-N(7))-methyltransferase RsmG [Ornithobacterium rhinotracheale]|uniref:16S rRNA (guanine(527)-N(7))-methyltransferase RsmG n=1 Tax=Ornithobacterium rhinotracheale TaxID=28251 RepID=UPI00129CB4B4|nr:16S rRNA (guanine(527)-N(7))-methyltransferase RsmG [Ornithobacterium rhinotracheale]MRJ08469.1 16S rRNA (guanine(527)-N(7))-methyltransferase RsmG [Ornithobacterium rhinotracheale]UOH76744.1 16S rRNA (guanine(527)-N(7))-methyltransferase RsmG [Ornithobacterium rhinotracheale]
MEYHLIEKYFPALSETQKKQFEQLGTLYPEWNEKINVISRKDIEELYTRHVLHSLAIAKVYEFLPNQKVLDVGTGGGFPGIPLAILFPETQFHLVDSIGKKILVVQNIAEALGLKNVVAEQKRVEKIKDKYHFVVSRAVTQMPKFMAWIKGKFLTQEFENQKLKNGILYLKGGDLSEELKDYSKAKIYNISDFYTEDFFDTKKVVYLAMNTK